MLMGTHSAEHANVVKSLCRSKSIGRANAEIDGLPMCGFGALKQPEWHTETERLETK